MIFIGLALAFFLIATPAEAIPVAFVATALGLSLTGWAAAAITFALNFVLAAALSFVAQALFKPSVPSTKAPGAADQASVDNKITVRQSAASRQIVYGEMRIGGIYAFIHSTDSNNHLHVVVMVAGHEIDSFQEVWVNDAAYSVEDDLDDDGFISKAGDKFGTKLRFKFHLGAADQAADADLIAECGSDAWSTTDRLRGIAYAYVRLVWNADTFGGGVPNLSFVVRGKNDIYDPRDESTDYSANSALCLANYLCDATYGIPVDYDTGIDEAALIAAANICDEEITLAGGGSEVRYRTDGVMTSDAQPQEIIGKLLGAMHGKAPYDGERWKIMAGAYATPSLTFTDDDLRAGPKIQTITSRKDLFNAVKGTYIGASPPAGDDSDAPRNNYQVIDFPPVVSDTYRDQDGQRLWKDISLPLTTSATRAQRIAKIDLLKARQQIVATMPCKLSVWRCQAGDTVLWTSERYGWTAKPFEVASAKFSVDDNPPTLGVDLVLRETAASVYDWSSSEESAVDPAPNTNFPDVFNVLPASNLTVTELLYSTRDGGGVKAKARLSWTASADAFVTSGGAYRAAWRLSGTSVWTYLPPTAALFADVLDIDPGIYDFRLEAVNWAGTLSDPLTVTQSIAGLSAAPSPLTGFTVNASGGLAIARYNLSPDLDVREGGSIVFRHSALATGATWADGTTISEPLSGNSSMAVLPLKAGTYMAKCVDSSGIWSGMASFVQTQASVLSFSTLSGGTLVEDPVFGGTKSGCFVSEGELLLGAAGEFDDVPDVDALLLWDYTGGVASTGSYLFSAPMDLGSVKKCRLTSAMRARVENIYDDFDSRTGEVDDWPDWDGAMTGNEADAVLMVRSTTGNPAGSPTWSDWQRLDSADFVARGFQFRLDLSSTDVSFNIAISSLAVVAEGI